MTTHGNKTQSNNSQGVWCDQGRSQTKARQERNNGKNGNRNRNRASTAYEARRPGSQAVQLNAMICQVADSQGAWALLDLIGEHMNQMSFVNLSTAMHRLAKLAKNKGLLQAISKDRRLHALQGRIYEVVAQQETSANDVDVENGNYARCWQTIVWSQATLGLTDNDVFQRIGNFSVTHLSRYQPLELANLLWAFAKSGISHKRLFNTAVKEIPNRVHDCGLVNLSTIAWAFATSGHKPSTYVLKCLAEEFVSRIEEAESQAISNMIWALATAKVVQPQIFIALANVATQMIATFNIQEISNTAWAIAKAGIAHVQFFMALSVKLKRDQHFIAQIHPQGVSNILWALAKESILLNNARICQEAMEALLPACRARLHMFKPQEYSATLLSCAKMSVQFNGCTELDTLFAEAALVYTKWDLNCFSPRALSSLLQAFLLVSKLSPRRAILYKAFIVALGEAATERIGDFEPMGLILILVNLEENIHCSSLGKLRAAAYTEIVRWCPSLTTISVSQLAELASRNSVEYRSAIMCGVAQRALNLGLSCFAEGELAKLAQMCNLPATCGEMDLEVGLIRLASSDQSEPCDIGRNGRNAHKLNHRNLGPGGTSIDQDDLSDATPCASHCDESNPSWSDLNNLSASESGCQYQRGQSEEWSNSESGFQCKHRQHEEEQAMNGPEVVNSWSPSDGFQYQHGQSEEGLGVQGNSNAQQYPQHLHLFLGPSQRQTTSNVQPTVQGSSSAMYVLSTADEVSLKAAEDDASSTCSHRTQSSRYTESSRYTANRMFSDNDYQDSCYGDYEERDLDGFEVTTDGGSEWGDSSTFADDEGGTMPQFTFGAGGFTMQQNMQQQGVANLGDVSHQEQQSHFQPGMVDPNAFLNKPFPSGFPSASEQRQAWSQEFRAQKNPQMSCYQ